MPLPSNWVRRKKKPKAQPRGKFRSNLEWSIALQLDNLCIPFGYETMIIDYYKPSTRHYLMPEQDILPETKIVSNHKYYLDFNVADGQLLIEAKGVFDAPDRRKHRLIREQHPELDIRFVFSNPRAKWGKTGKTYEWWCNRYGFKYAKKRIPDEWIQELELR